MDAERLVAHEDESPIVLAARTVSMSNTIVDSRLV
jgi:hypothetical protein